MSAILGGSRQVEPSVEGATRAILLEQHYYEGGLKVRVLGSDPNRPYWVPPSEWVGFRNELPLRGGDHVIEFVRFRYQENLVTWIGLFHPSIDAKYGDRQNHAGIGVWLLDRDVLHGSVLLQSLRAFLGTNGEGASANAAAADRFVSEFLQTIVTPHFDLPPPLGGWLVARSEITDTALFEAVASDQETAWLLAAQQLLRLTVLANSVSAQTRAIILVAHGAGGSRGLQPLQDNLAVEIVAALPRAFDGVFEQSQAVAREAAGATELVRLRETEAAEARSRSDGLEERARILAEEVAELRSALDQSEPARHYAAIREALRNVSEDVIAVDTSVREARRDLGSQIERLRQQRAQREELDRTARPSLDSGRLASERPKGGAISDEPRRSLLTLPIIVCACAFLVIIVSLAVLYWPTAPAAPESRYETPLVPDR